MKAVSFTINLVIVVGICIELVLILFGRLSADELLISSGLSGLVILISLKLLKDGLSKFYVAAASQRDEISQDINLTDEINDHIMWKAGLQSYLDGGSDEKFGLDQIMSDNQCSLGRWLHGPAQEYFGANNSGLRMLLEQHSRLHVTAGFVVRNIQNNNRTAAKKIMNREFQKAFQEFILTMNALNSVITAR